MVLFELLLKYLLLCLLWLCDLMGCKRARNWVSKVVKEPDLSTEKHVV